MPNIMLTYSCNLNCCYCFANEFVNKKNNYITIENFQKALSFSKTTRGERIALIGGEPTVHPKFNEILDILLEDKDINKVLIFTNGLNIDKYIDKLSNSKFDFLVNCNSPEQIKSNYEKLVNNLEMLNNIHNQNLGKNDYTKQSPFSIGINLYDKQQDYQYFIELAEKFSLKDIRMAITVPNSHNLKGRSSIEYFKEMKDITFSFIKDCLVRKIVPRYDCNNMPPCIFETEQLEEIRNLLNACENASISNILNGVSLCTPVVDILPDLNAVRCFGLSDFIKVPISDFKSVAALRGYFGKIVDSYKLIVNANSKCEKCYFNNISACSGGCLAYKIKEIKAASDLISKKIHASK